MRFTGFVGIALVVLLEPALARAARHGEERAVGSEANAGGVEIMAEREVVLDGYVDPRLVAGNIPLVLERYDGRMGGCSFLPPPREVYWSGRAADDDGLVSAIFQRLDSAPLAPNEQPLTRTPPPR